MIDKRESESTGEIDEETKLAHNYTNYHHPDVPQRTNGLFSRLLILAAQLESNILPIWQIFVSGIFFLRVWKSNDH